MGAYLSTAIASPQVVAAGGIVAGTLTVTSPSAGNFYMLMEQYTSALVFIPGSRSYLHLDSGGVYVNSTTLVTTRTRAAADVEEVATVSLTIPNTNCLLYIFLKQRATNVVAGAFVVGTTYEIMVIGTTDFTLIGATNNTVGLEFTATDVGVGTGEAAELVDPDADDTVDYVVITVQSAAPTAPAIDINTLIQPLITIMIVMMMMKMMVGTMASEIK